MLWHPTKPKIQDWVDSKVIEFVQKESEGYWLNLNEWLERYLYTYIHDIAFCEFLILLHNWSLRLAT